MNGVTVSVVGVLFGIAWAAPADELPTPRPERCLTFEADPEENEILAAEGLGYHEVQEGLRGVINHALRCTRPEGRDAIALTFDVTIGCDGIVSKMVTVDDDDAPEDYVQCVSDVIAKADFPGHDLPDGMEFTYPVNINW